MLAIMPKTLYMAWIRAAYFKQHFLSSALSLHLCKTGSGGSAFIPLHLDGDIKARFTS